MWINRGENPMALRYAKGSKVPKFGITVINDTDYIYWSGITMYWELINTYHSDILGSATFESAEWRFRNMESNLSWFIKDAYILEARGSEENREALKRLVSVAYFMLEQAAEHIRTLK